MKMNIMKKSIMKRVITVMISITQEETLFGF